MYNTVHLEKEISNERQLVVWAEDGFWSQIKVPLNAGTGMEVIRKKWGDESEEREGDHQHFT